MVRDLAGNLQGQKILVRPQRRPVYIVVDTICSHLSATQLNSFDLGRSRFFTRDECGTLPPE